MSGDVPQKVRYVSCRPIRAHNSMYAVKTLNRVVGTVLVVKLADGRLAVEVPAQDGVKDELAKLAPPRVTVSPIDNFRGAAQHLVGGVGCTAQARKPRGQTLASSERGNQQIAQIATRRSRSRCRIHRGSGRARSPRHAPQGRRSAAPRRRKGSPAGPSARVYSSGHRHPISLRQKSPAISGA